MTKLHVLDYECSYIFEEKVSAYGGKCMYFLENGIELFTHVRIYVNVILKLFIYFLKIYQ